MIDEERREAERLANKYAASKGVAHGKRTEPAWMYTVKDFTAGYLAGRESMREEMKQNMPAWEIRVRLNQALSKHEELYNGRSKAWDDLLAERERSAKLVEAIKDYIECDGLLSSDGKPSFSAQEFIAAIAEYEEASREI